jgi:hypothetical protein
MHSQPETAPEGRVCASQGGLNYELSPSDIDDDNADAVGFSLSQIHLTRHTTDDDEGAIKAEPVVERLFKHSAKPAKFEFKARQYSGPSVGYQIDSTPMPRELEQKVCADADATVLRQHLK